MSVSSFPHGTIAAAGAGDSIFTQNVSRSHNASGADDSVASVRVSDDGYVYTSAQTDTNPTDFEYDQEYQWLLSGSASNYDVRFTVTFGPTEQGTVYPTAGDSFNVWQIINSDRDGHLKDDSSTSLGAQTDATILIEFSLTGQSTTIASFEASLDAQCFT